MAEQITPDTWAEHDRLMENGWSRAATCKKVGVHPATSWRRDNKLGIERAQANRARQQKAQRDPSRVGLSPEAKRALDDFAFFRRRYFGRRATPWQVGAANQMLAWLAEPDKVYAVVNCPPGSGKSTLFTLDFLAWLICRDRSVRILIGSYTERQAKAYVDRLRRVLEATTPAIASDFERRQGSRDADATLAEDFGRFQPLSTKVPWNSREFTVERAGLSGNIEKEKTIAGFGMDSAFLGGRFDVVVWDDLVDEKNNRSPEVRKRVQEWFDSTAESRIEPGGLFVLQGQRLGPDDLYRYALDKKGYVDEDDEDQTPQPKYRHILYRAHDTSRCRKQHGKDAPPWDGTDEGGCLLDPVRLPWRELAEKASNNPQTYLTVYQQEDAAPSSVLVPMLWVTGGTGENGELYPGCWDDTRQAGVVPRGLTGQLFSVATADPSPTQWWAVQWWLYHPDSGFRYLVDLHRAKMSAPEFLAWNPDLGDFTGLMEEWQRRSVAQGAPITHWVVEQNAAQRFMLQYEHVHRWQAKHATNIVAHTTSANKADPEFGVQSIATQWRFGRVRLPGYPYDHSRTVSMKLVDEVTKWPYGRTEDCVMAEWFFEYTKDRLFTPNVEAPQFKRPGWLTRGRQLIHAS